MNANSRSYYLFARPSFFEGVARLVDFSGSLQVYNESESEARADAWALAGDWWAIGDDLRTVLHHYDERIPASEGVRATRAPARFAGSAAR